MVSRIESERISGRPVVRGEPAAGESARSRQSPAANDEADVRISLSESARQLSGFSNPVGEPAPADGPGEQGEAASPDAADPRAFAAPGPIADDILPDPEPSDADPVARGRRVAAYREATRSEVGARISIRV